MKYVSICSGIGAFESAIDKVYENAECVFASEIDGYAQKSYRALYPHELKGDIWETINEVPSHDMLVAGIPCQSYSNEGNRQGLCDTRGTLFYAVEQITKTHKPKVVIIENVQGLLTHDKGETLRIMLSNFNTLGYLVDFDLLNAMNFNLPQSRDRFFLVAVREDLVKESEWSVSDTKLVNRRKEELQEIRSFYFNFNKGDITTKTIHDILEENWDERFIASQKIHEHLVVGREDNYLKIKEGVKQGWTPAYEGDVVNIEFPTSKNRRGRVGKQVANTINATGTANQAVVMNDNGRLYLRRLTPLEYWRLQGFTDEQFLKASSVEKMSNKQLYKQAGNSIPVPMVESIIQEVKLLLKS